jgi:hypothetical protein
MGENLWTLREHLGSVLGWNNQHEQSLSCLQWHHSNADSVQGYNQGQTQMLCVGHGPCNLGRWIRDNLDLDQSHGLGRRNHQSILPWEHGDNSSGSARIEEEVQQRVWCHHPLGPVGPPTNSGPHWAVTSLAAMISAAICTFAIGICIWRLCCRSKDPLMPFSPPLAKLGKGRKAFPLTLLCCWVSCSIGILSWLNLTFGQGSPS